jgi:hypothetical protein
MERVSEQEIRHIFPFIVPGALSLAIKRQGREAGHSPPSSAEVKNAWSYTSTPQYAFMTWYSVNFTFLSLPFIQGICELIPPHWLWQLKSQGSTSLMLQCTTEHDSHESLPFGSDPQSVFPYLPISIPQVVRFQNILPKILYKFLISITKVKKLFKFSDLIHFLFRKTVRVHIDQ